MCAQLESRAGAGDVAGAAASVEAVVTDAAAVSKALAAEVGGVRRHG